MLRAVALKKLWTEPITASGRVCCRGNMLLAAIVLVTIVTLILAMSMQPANTAKQRMLERELIYRGEHLAEGIRRFYNKYGRFPYELDELIDDDPRFVRKLYTDPMTEEGDWTLVYLTAQDTQAVKSLNAAQRRLTEAVTGESLPDEVNSENIDENPQAGGSSLFNSRRQQITGLRSKSEVEGFMIRDDSSIHSDWLFTSLPKPKDDLGSLLNTETGVERKP